MSESAEMKRIIEKHDVGNDRGGGRFDKSKGMGPSGDFNPEFSRGGQDGYRAEGGGMRGGFGRGGGQNFEG